MWIVKTLLLVISLFAASRVNAETWFQMDYFHQALNNKASSGYYLVDEDSIENIDDAETIKIKYVFTTSPYPNVYDELVSKVQFKCDAHKFRDVENIKYKNGKIVNSSTPLKFINIYKDIITGSVNDKVFPIACGQTTIAQLQQEKDKNLKGRDAQQTSLQHSESTGGWVPEQKSPEMPTTKVTTDYKYSDGSLYVGALKNGLPHGTGLRTATNGNRYEGEFLNGVQNGAGTFYYGGGGTITGVFKDGYPTNTAIYTDNNGNHFHGQYKQLSPYNGDIYNASNQSIGKVINGKITSGQQNQSVSGEGLNLGKIFGAIVEGAAAYQEGKNSVRKSQVPLISSTPRADPIVEQHSYVPLPPTPLPRIEVPKPAELLPMPAISGKISGD